MRHSNVYKFEYPDLPLLFIRKEDPQSVKGVALFGDSCFNLFQTQRNLRPIFLSLFVMKVEIVNIRQRLAMSYRNSPIDWVY